MVALCTRHGARNLSELARGAMQDLLEPEPGNGHAEANGGVTEVHKLSLRIADLDRHLNKLTRLLTRRSSALHERAR